MTRATYTCRRLDIRFGVVPLPIYLILAGLIAAIGLRPQNVHRVFDAFYPTKPAAWAWGSICRSIVEDHGGHLWASGHEQQVSVLVYASSKRCDQPSLGPLLALSGHAEADDDVRFRGRPEVTGRPSK